MGFIRWVLVVLLFWICTGASKGVKRDEFVDKVKEGHMKDGKHNKEFDRDVLWGDGRESEDDEGDNDVENLSPEEQKKRLKLLVENRIDKDKDGSVSIEELAAWTERSYDLFETEETREMFPDIDKNKDGAIQWPEYALDTYGEDFNEESPDFVSPPSDEWEEFVKSYKNEEIKFHVADMDGSQDLDLQEFQYFKHPRLHEKTRQVVIQEVLGSSDLNKDGAIDIDEFLGDYQKKGDADDPEWSVFERQKFEHEFDIDNDGVLKGMEIVNWMAPDNKVLAAEEAEHLMEETDANHDDRLTVDEILNNHLDWVDSDATDYGRQLLKHHEEL